MHRYWPAFNVIYILICLLWHSNSIHYCHATSSNEPQDPCDACKVLVKSFDVGLELTARGKHEGGDTSWEERNLRSYADSEVRLVEIQEQLCHDLKEYKSECHSLAEDTESEIEQWWFNQRNKNVRLFDYLCISKLKRCCPSAHYGPQCTPCPNCNDHGTCAGNGTRQGDGHCECEPGYIGDNCRECESGYYTTVVGELDQGPVTCHLCDPACIECSGPGHLMCVTCNVGYQRDPTNNACWDIDECKELPGHGNCTRGTYCSNIAGSYECLSCHRACSLCDGPSEQNCLECSATYRLVDGKCMKQANHQSMIDFLMRYTNYAVFVVSLIFLILLSHENYLLTAVLGVLIGIGWAYTELYTTTEVDHEDLDQFMVSSSD